MSENFFKTEIEKMQKNGVIFYTFNMLKDDYEAINIEKKIIKNGNEYIEHGYRLSPKFKNKDLVKEFEREYKIYFINEMEINDEINDDIKDWLKENVMTMQEFEKMVEDWDTARKLKEVVKNSGNKFKNKKRVM